MSTGHNLLLQSSPLTTWPPVDGKWGDWGKWGSCNELCGAGNRTRGRTCYPPAFGGLDCQGEANQTEACHGETCPGRRGKCYIELSFIHLNKTFMVVQMVVVGSFLLLVVSANTTSPTSGLHTCRALASYMGEARRLMADSNLLPDHGDVGTKGNCSAGKIEQNTISHKLILLLQRTKQHQHKICSRRPSASVLPWST